VSHPFITPSICHGGEEQHDLHVQYCVPLAEQLADTRTLTASQIHGLVSEAISQYRENVDVHAMGEEQAGNEACWGVIDGLFTDLEEETRTAEAPAVEGLQFIVLGVPKAKGSMKHVGHGRMIEQLAGSKPWREAVKWAALEAIAAREGTGEPFATLSGPVVVDVVFSFAKPKSAPKTRRIWPTTRSSGDVDKLLRNVLDALVDAAVMGDDSQVVRAVPEKAFVGEHPAALNVPGATIVVRALGGGA
jgi:Holliday junction resolvase RusA-like endonuclease